MQNALEQTAALYLVGFGDKESLQLFFFTSAAATEAATGEAHPLLVSAVSAALPEGILSLRTFECALRHRSLSILSLATTVLLTAEMLHLYPVVPLWQLVNFLLLLFLDAAHLTLGLLLLQNAGVNACDLY